MYIIQYATMQDGRYPVMAPSTERLLLDGIYICVKSNAHTQAGPTKTATFKTGHKDGAATLSRYSLKWEGRQIRLCKHKKNSS